MGVLSYSVGYVVKLEGLGNKLVIKECFPKIRSGVVYQLLDLIDLGDYRVIRIDTSKTYAEVVEINRTDLIDQWRVSREPADTRFKVGNCVIRTDGDIETYIADAYLDKFGGSRYDVYYDDNYTFDTYWDDSDLVLTAEGSPTDIEEIKKIKNRVIHDPINYSDLESVYIKLKKGSYLKTEDKKILLEQIKWKKNSEIVMNNLTSVWSSFQSVFLALADGNLPRAYETLGNIRNPYTPNATQYFIDIKIILSKFRSFESKEMLLSKQ